MRTPSTIPFSEFIRKISHVPTDEIPRNKIRTLMIHNGLRCENIHSATLPQRWTLSLIKAVLIVTLSTSFVMGVNIGGPNVYNSFIVPWTRGYPFPCQKDDETAQWIAQVWWKCDYKKTLLFNKTGYYYLPTTPMDKQVWERFTDAIHTICFVSGGTVGGFTAKYWYKYLTRRNAIVPCMIYQLIASILMIIPLYIYHGYTRGDPDRKTIRETFEYKEIAIALFYISRFLSGLSAGMSCVVTTIYLMDISPRTMRGNIMTFHQLFIVVGVLVGQIIGVPWLFGQHDKWNWGMAWVGLFSLAGCFLIWTLPESPRWLVQERERNEAAVSLRHLRRSNLIEAELEEIERQEASVTTQDLSFYTMCSSTRFRWPLITSIALNAIQQLSGINTIFFYSHEILSALGFVKDRFYWSVISTGLINLVATVVTLKLVESIGRRPLILCSLGIITFIMVLLCIFIQTYLSIAALILMLIFIAVFALGLGPIAFVYPNEVFTIDMRPAALSISISANWLCNTLVTIFFPVLSSIFQGYVFLIFCFWCLLAFVLLWYKMPETKRKKLSQIQAFW
ncbi:unnamed protein product [Adineta ricciae]|uniref:Major facilitator superfamily (MFS) profile domain-containing protein n=1 Tax=Adineta ricciae TaxID=249248 RepID=A0A814V6C0_ADIRI|nr:unnamed protein product [Adineta ricciae]CAF1254139.1 unnamed protein product [Adineta ricciae]